jgi:tetratricopeptide (TPR) repeat protein
MKKALIGMMFLAAANVVFAGGSRWAPSGKFVYDGESEIIFSYTGPEGVLACVYGDGEFFGTLKTGETERMIVGDGSHTIEVHSGVYNEATKKTVEDPQALSLRVTARKNRNSVKIAISRTNTQNRVTELTLTNTVAIETLPKPQQNQASGPNQPTKQQGAQNQSSTDNTQIDEYQKLINIYSVVIWTDPTNAEAYTKRGKVYEEKGDYDQAIADHNQAIQFNPNLAIAYTNRGLAYYRKGDYDRAIADHTQAIRLNPNLAEAYFSRGNGCYSKGEYDRAITDYTQAIRLDPSFANAYSNRGIAYFNKGEYARARADWEKVLQLNPNHADARQNLEVLRGMGY